MRQPPHAPHASSPGGMGPKTSKTSKTLNSWLGDAEPLGIFMCVFQQGIHGNPKGPEEPGPEDVANVQLMSS